VEVSEGAGDSLGAITGSSIGAGLFSSAKTGATIVSKIPVTMSAPMRLAKTEGS
jgi:hypothetical protein